ncbi:hypothetical protein OT109_08315 [Phycisphaeraceae bacterium D3-23]
MSTPLIQWMDRHRFVLAFFALLAAGGGCMQPYRSSELVDLKRLGVDEYTQARLNGAAELRPGDPAPVCNLYGEVLVVSLDYRRRHTDDERDKKIEDIVAPIGELQGVTSVGYLPIHNLVEAQNRDYADDNRPAASLRESLMAEATRTGADFLLVYTVRTDSQVTDITLTLGSMLTLGTAPTKIVTGEAELEAVLMDAQTGYIYALAQADGDAWGATNRVNQTRAQYREDYEAQRVALRVLVERLEAAWPAMRAAYP